MNKSYVLLCCQFHVGSSMRRLVGRFGREEWRGGVVMSEWWGDVVMSAGKSCIELCGGGGMERGTLRRKNRQLQTSTRPLKVLM